MPLTIDSDWKPVNIGAGGWITGIDVAPDGTMIARTDTYGAYIWNGTSWEQLATAESMPSSVFWSAGVYEIRVAPSNSNIFYMEMGDGIYKSVDRGETWVRTSFPITMDTPNLDYRMNGQKMAIDPTNPNIVFAGTQHDGLWVTRDGGSTWQKIAAVPQGTDTKDPGLTGIVIQGNTVYVGTAGSGIYASNDGGLTWKSIGGPANVAYAAITPDGTYFAADNSAGALWKFENGSWTKVIADSVHAIAVDPFDPEHIVVTTPGGSIQQSHDGGVTWSGWNWNSQLESSHDIPWLETSGLYMSSGGLVFDPLVEGRLWQSSGVGVWETSVPEVLAWNTPIVWNSHSMGIEQLVTNEILAPAGADPLFASWDRAFFSMSDVDTYAGTYGGGAFSMGWSVDYASTNSTFIVGISDWWGQENSGFSTDGGKTWQKFAGLPSWATATVGGSIAASSTTNFVWVTAGGSPPAYTLDGGKTWQNVNIPGKTDWSGLQYSYFLERTVITADRVLPNTFYLYDSNDGMYRSSDGGVSWTKMFDGQISPWSYWNAKIESVPGSPGELYFTSGPQGTDMLNAPDMLSLMHSTDGGKTWTAVPNVNAASFGYGAPATPGGPATVYVVGEVKGVWGIWYSTDASNTWTQIGDRPMGSLDMIRTISGDMDQFGRVYIGFGGSGYAYLDIGGTPTAPAPAPAPLPAPTAPTQLASIVSAIDDVGSSLTVRTGGLVNDATPTLSGTLSAALNAGERLVVYRDGVAIGNASGSTNWTFTDPGATDGSHQYLVRVENGSGLTGVYSASFGLTVDTVAPVTQVTVSGAVKQEAVKGGLTVSTVNQNVTGTISAPLGADEKLIVYRDGVAVGTATVNGNSWSFGDSVGNGVYVYTAQVQDSAQNLGAMSKAVTIQFGMNEIYGTSRSDHLVGTSGNDIISGVASSGAKVGRGTIDFLTGGDGNDVFVLGDSRGVFYTDSPGRDGCMRSYAHITDFQAGDHIQLSGSATDYLQATISNLGGYSGLGIYYDSNHNGVLDSTDEFIALVHNVTYLDPSSFSWI